MKVNENQIFNDNNRIEEIAIPFLLNLEGKL